MNYNKIYVKNIQVDTSNEDIDNSLKDCVGYKKNVLFVNKNSQQTDSTLSGIIFVEGKENFISLLNNTNICVNGNILKLFKFKNKPNKLFIVNLPNDITQEDLQKALEPKYGKTRCFVKTNHNGITSASVNVFDKQLFNQALNDKNLTINENTVVTMKLFRKFIKIPFVVNSMTNKQAFLLGLKQQKKY